MNGPVRRNCHALHDAQAKIPAVESLVQHADQPPVECLAVLHPADRSLAEFAVYRLADAKKQNNKWYFRLSLVTNAVSFSIGEILALMSG